MSEGVKTYVYTVFLRNPKTMETQYGKIEFEHGGYMDCHTLFEKLSSEQIKRDLYVGYTLIAMQIVEVLESCNE